jgi:hypothetical protein
VSLSEKKKPRVKLRKGMTHNMRLIEELAHEQQWEGPDDPDIDVGFGGREPE